MTRILLSLALLIQREDRSPSPAHSKPVPPPKIYTEEKGEKTIQKSHGKKWYQRLFSWKTSQRAVSVDNSTSKRVPGHISVFVALLWLICLLK